MAETVEPNEGGILDVSDLTLSDLDKLDTDILRTALDSILADGRNTNGYHGFTNHI